MILVGVIVSHQVIGVCKVKLVSSPPKGQNLVIYTVGRPANMNFICKLPMKLTLSLGQLRREVIYGEDSFFYSDTSVVWVFYNQRDVEVAARVV